MQTMFRSPGIDIFEQLGGALEFVAPDPKACHIAIPKLNRQIHDLLRFLRPKLAHRIENPEQRDAKIFFSTVAAALQALKDRRKLLLPP